MIPRLSPVLLDIPMIFAVFLVVVPVVLCSAYWLGNHLSRARPEPSMRRFTRGVLALVVLFLAGAVLGEPVLLFAPFVLALGWCLFSFANTTARIRVGDELLAAGIYPSWMPWTCPRCDTDCRESPYPCPEAVELLHPTTKAGPWDSPAVARERARFEELARREDRARFGEFTRREERNR